MRPEFVSLYAQLAESYARIPPSRWFPHGKTVDTIQRAPGAGLSLVIRSVRRAVAELELGSRLRSDAYHFLVVNMHQMVALPILSSAMVSRRTPRPDEQDLRRPDPSTIAIRQLQEDLEHDARLILSRAEEVSEHEISGRAILQATSQVYEQLRTAASNVWG